MNERQLINFERMADNQPLLYPPLNEQEVKQHKLNERINQSRGGGGGDFTTAKVTLKKTDGYMGSIGTYQIPFPFAWEGWEGEGSGLIVEQDGNIFYYDESWTDTAEIYVPLFKGMAFINVFVVSSGFNPSYISCSGDAQFDPEGPAILIAGDCTITLSGGGK